jgi:Rha family phage regulatory protein
MDMDLIVSQKSSEFVATSREIAEAYGKIHYGVLRDIDRIRKYLPNFGAENYVAVETIKKNAIGGTYKVKHYEMSRDGFVMLIMGFTGKKAMEFKMEYLEAYNRMEAELIRRCACPTFEDVLNLARQALCNHGAVMPPLLEKIVNM